jgi:hypothetical protein
MILSSKADPLAMTPEDFEMKIVVWLDFSTTLHDTVAKLSRSWKHDFRKRLMQPPHKEK